MIDQFQRTAFGIKVIEVICTGILPGKNQGFYVETIGNSAQSVFDLKALFFVIEVIIIKTHFAPPNDFCTGSLAI
ncbi:MAG: hypothetical protein BWY75_02567 [bacterium ADurb.Bin425]|nr:MAG: hypothetical protein BWY75_02567 [bacterium ADurb.Bin425]